MDTITSRSRHLHSSVRIGIQKSPVLGFCAWCVGQRCWPQFVNERVRQERECGIEVSGTEVVEEFEYELDLRGIKPLFRHARHELISSMGG